MLFALLAATIADPSAYQADKDCMTLYLIAAGTAKDDKSRNAAIAGTYYFYGRLDQNAPSADLRKELAATTTRFEKMSEAEAVKIGTACDKRLETVGNRLSTVGDE